MHTLILLLERLFRRRFLRNLILRRMITSSMWWGPIIGSSTVLFVIRIILSSGVSGDRLQCAALHWFKRAFSLRCHRSHLWVRRIDVRILNELFSFKKVILELFESSWGSQSRLIDFLHFFPYLFNRKIDKVLSGPGLANISQVLRITIALNRVGRVLLLVHKIKPLSAPASSCWLSLKKGILL